MRFALVCVLVSGVLAALAGGAGGAAPGPTLRVATGPSLVIVGAGFEPRTVVRLRVTGLGVDRGATVRASGRGSFTVLFDGLGSCSILQATATARNGTRARVPIPRFLRECPPPPPLATGMHTAD